jgi:hypothetical protein
MESYKLTAEDVAKVNEERGYRTASVNEAVEGDEYPMVVVRHNDDGSVNGQVFLDGPDTLWVPNVQLNQPVDPAPVAPDYSESTPASQSVNGD